ncbi:Ger(x)C family spore germination protein [Neobacillus sp. K501]
MNGKWFVAFIALCILLTGCSGLKNIQDITYIVAIGMDYHVEKKEYTVYLQSLNFANVAKQEGSKPTEPIPTFVASATGETLNLAVRELYKESEPPLFFGHVNTIVISDRILTNRFQEVVEEIGRNRSLRHTIRVMTTREEIRDVFNIKALFNYPAVYTVLYKKNTNEILQDEIRPMSLLKFLREFHEPMGVAKLPVLTIDKKSWKAHKSYPVLYYDGYAMFQQQKYIKEIPFHDALYINWLLEDKVSIDQRVEEDGKLVAAVKMSSPKMKVKYEKGTSEPNFSIVIQTQADLLEKVKDVPLEKLQNLIEEEVKRKIHSLYLQGIESNSDFLNVGEKWFREHPSKYHALKKSKKFYLTKDSLKDLKVEVQIFHFNSYKYEQRSASDN